MRTFNKVRTHFTPTFFPFFHVQSYVINYIDNMAELLTLQNFIDGKFVPCAQYIDSYDPSTGKPHARVPDSDNKEIELAVQAAKKAFPR